MATAAESHMMQRSERDREVRKSEKKKNKTRSERVGHASRRQRKRGEERDGNEVK